jgi:hypothetical protein
MHLYFVAYSTRFYFEERILLGTQETFAIVIENGKVITRDELINQIGLLLPFDLEQFYIRRIISKNK